MADRRKTYTDQEKAEALRMYEEEGPSAVQKNLGIPKGTVTGWAKEADIRTVRNEKTRDATAASQADAKALRAQLEVLYAQDALKLRAMLWQPSTIVSAGQVITTDLPTPEGMRNLATASGIVFDKSVAARDADTDNGVRGAVSLLDSLREGLGMGREH